MVVVTREEKRKKAVKQVTWLTVLAVVIGTAWIILYAWQAQNIPSFLSIIGVSATLGGAFLMSGLLLGFIFGYAGKQKPKPESPPLSPPLSPPNQTETPSQDISTNLEQISEWLTKVIVGAGLTQLASMPTFLKKFGEYVKPRLGNLSGGEIFAVGLLLYFFTCGFLSGYLLTRLYFLGLLNE